MADNRSSFFVLLMMAALIAAWLLVAKFVGSPTIASAYRGESISFINEVISGRNVHSLEFYLHDWDRLTRKVAVVLAAAGAATSVLLHPRLQRFVDSRWPVQSVGAGFESPMRGYRVLLVNLVILLIVGLSSYAIARPVELWPFSPYPMYASVARGKTVEYLRPYGVTEAKDSNVIPLIQDDYIYPLDIGKFNDMIQILLREHDQPRIVNVLRDSLNRYEERRLDGNHSGPPLLGMRVYRLTWSLDPWAANRDQPDEMELIAETYVGGQALASGRRKAELQP